MTTKFMTNLDSRFYSFIQEEAKNKAISKREVLEGIISKYIEWKKSEEIKDAYASMGKDNEYLSEMQDNTTYLGTL